MVQNRIQIKMIFGSSKESFLDALDDRLVELNKSGKIWFAVSFGCVGVYMIIVKLFIK